LEEIDSEENCLEEIDLEGDDLEGKFGYSWFTCLRQNHYNPSWEVDDLFKVQFFHDF
jgi:hypothetical protein